MVRALVVAFAIVSSTAWAQAPTPEEAASAPDAPAPETELSSDEEVREQLAALTTPGGLTSERAAERAVTTAPSMERARIAVRAAEAGARQAWQGFFPQLELSARYTRLSRVTQPAFGGVGFSGDQLAAARAATAAVDDEDARFLWNTLIDAFGDTDSFSFPVLLNQYAFRASITLPVSEIALSVLPGYRAADTAADAQRAQVSVEERAVRLRARESYYELARARAALTVAEKAVEQVSAQRRQIAALVEAGAAARVDLLRVDALLAQSRVNVARAQGGSAIAERALRLLMHAEAGEEIVIGEDFSQAVASPPGSLPELTQQALRDRTELQALSELADARERNIRAELGRQYPQLLVQANFDLSNPNNRIIPQQQEFNGTWDLSVLLRWSPNEMGVARQRAEQARASLLETRADIDALRDAVRLEVAQSYEELTAAQLAFEAARVGLTAAEETYRVRSDQLRAGAAVTSDVIDAEAELTQARLQLFDAAIGVRLARARLGQAIGE
ncbi:MAG: TolC family protein [Myxococcota bacterium]